VKTAFKIRLTQQENRELRLVVRREKAPYRKVIRARMILLLSRDECFCKVSRVVGVARRIVYKWAKRFIVMRIAGLKDKPRSGRPARFSPDRIDLFGEASMRTSGSNGPVAITMDLCRAGPHAQTRWNSRFDLTAIGPANSCFIAA